MFEFFTWLADVLTYDIMGIERATKLADAVHFFIEDTSKIFFLLTGPVRKKWSASRSLSQPVFQT
ncbi:hypothetical protein [Terasakiella pusilla]|uniref:hypothetical protein n=1 Tax=Terasakiella pusilla TaxID=64973 RepID=UPI000A590366|nr:hypothetical protein [Terasakiella pusilla]